MASSESGPRPSSAAVEPGDVAIVVPVGGCAPAWQRAARSLARLDPPPGEIVVVIDGPLDDQAAIAREIGANVLALEGPCGPAVARNRGAAAAALPFLLFLDADVEVPPDLVAKLVAVLSAADAPAAVMGSYDDAPADPGFVSQYRNLLHHWVHQTGRREAETFWAGCGAIRRDRFLELGGFDEEYRVPSIEDIELGSRLRRAGEVIWLAKELQVTHLKRWHLVDMLATDLWRRAVPWTELMLADGRMVNDLNVKTRDRFSVALALAAGLALVGTVAWPPALVAGLAGVLLVVVLNADFFRLLVRRRGALFALGAVPCYWAYLLICGGGFALGAARHVRGLVRNRAS